MKISLSSNHDDYIKSSLLEYYYKLYDRLLKIQGDDANPKAPDIIR
jgi:hypothetical protein